jgi:hypothetical protein
VPGVPAASGPLIFGKQLDARIHPAQLLRLGAGGAELESDAPLAVFAPCSWCRPPILGTRGVEPLDGDVLAISEGDGVRAALVRFTGIGWEARERIDAFAAGHIGGLSSAAASR